MPICGSAARHRPKLAKNTIKYARIVLVFIAPPLSK
jgi:hypothetical protein